MLFQLLTAGKLVAFDDNSGKIKSGNRRRLKPARGARLGFCPGVLQLFPSFLPVTGVLEGDFRGMFGTSNNFHRREDFELWI